MAYHIMHTTRYIYVYEKEKKERKFIDMYNWQATEDEKQTAITGVTEKNIKVEKDIAELKSIVNKDIAELKIRVNEMSSTMVELAAVNAELKRGQKLHMSNLIARFI